MIRSAGEKDIDEVVRVSSRYANETLLNSIKNEDLKALVRLCLNTGILLVAEKDHKVVGVIAGRFMQGPSMGMFFEELIWYVEPENRGIGLMLYRRLAETCKAKGCAGISMGAYNNDHLDIVEKFYIREGYTEIERKYYKKL